MMNFVAPLQELSISTVSADTSCHSVTLRRSLNTFYGQACVWRHPYRCWERNTWHGGQLYTRRYASATTTAWQATKQRRSPDAPYRRSMNWADWRVWVRRIPTERQRPPSGRQPSRWGWSQQKMSSLPHEVMLWDRAVTGLISIGLLLVSLFDLPSQIHVISRNVWPQNCIYESYYWSLHGYFLDGHHGVQEIGVRV